MAALRNIAFVLAVIVALLAIPALRHLREKPPPPPPVLRLALDGPPGTELGSGDEVLDAAISPDERQIVFVATRAGATGLWRRALDSDRAEALKGTDGAQLPAWSPAGDAVAFFAGGRLRTISIADGAISDLAEAPSPAGVTWLPDGSILFAPRSHSVISRLRDGTVAEATKLRPGDRAHVFPSSAGLTGDFAYTAVGDNGRRTVRLVQHGEERDLATTSGHGQIAGGYLLVVRDETLIAQPVDEKTGGLTGRAIPVSTHVGVTTTGRSVFVASSRVLLTAPSSPRARGLEWFDMTGARTGASGDPGDYWQVRLSPDDEHAAVSVVSPLLRTLDIVLIPTVPGTDAEPLTLALAADSDPVWSPDGRRVAFRSLQTGRPALFSKRAHDTGAKEEPLLEADATPTDWRGPTVLFHETGQTSGSDIWSVDTRTNARTAEVKSGFGDSDGRLSPDGRWLAYVSDESGHPDIYAEGRPGGTRVRVSFAGGTRPRWTRDGRSLLFLRGSTIMRAELLAGSPARFVTAVPVLDVPGVRDFDVAHRRDAIVALVPVGSASPVPVSVVVDWQSAFSDRPAR